MQLNDLHVPPEAEYVWLFSVQITFFSSNTSTCPRDLHYNLNPS